MLDISNEIKQKYKSDNINYKLKVVIDGIEYNYKNVLQGSLKITESLCSKDDLDFSSVEKNVLNISLLNFSGNINSIYNKQIQIFHVMENPAIGISLGKFTIRNVEFESDYVVNITAYDFTDLLDIDVSDWWNNLVQYPISAKNLLLSLANFCHVQVDLPSTYCNHDFMINKNILVENTKGVEFLGYLQELSGCFFKFDRDGILKRISLNNTSSIEHIYPGINTFPSNSLYTDNASDITINENYDYTKIVSDVILADYNVSKIEKVQVKGSKNDIGVIVGTGSNTYEIQSNPLMYGLIDNQLRMYVENILNEIKNIVYKPFQAKVRTLPYLEVGDWIQLTTYKNKIAKAPIFKRIISGPSQYLDEISCKGKFNRKEIKSINKTINVLNQKMLEVVASVEEYSTTMTDKVEGLQTQVTQTASEVDIVLNGQFPPNLYPNSDFSQTPIGIYYLPQISVMLDGVETNYLTVTFETIDNEKVMKIVFKPTVFYRLRKEVFKDPKADIFPYETYVWNNELSKKFNLNVNVGDTLQFNRKIKPISYGNSFVNVYTGIYISKLKNWFGGAYINKGNLPLNQWFNSSNVATVTNNPDNINLNEPIDFTFSFGINVKFNTLEETTTAEDIVFYIKEPYYAITQKPLPTTAYNKYSSNDVISQINMTPEGIKIKGDKIDIEGLVTFANIQDQNGQTVINGGLIQASTIEAPVLRNVQSINGIPINATGDITVINWDGQLVKLKYNNGIVTGWDTFHGTSTYGSGINIDDSTGNFFNNVKRVIYMGGILRYIEYNDGRKHGTP